MLNVKSRLSLFVKTTVGIYVRETVRCGTGWYWQPTSGVVVGNCLQIIDWRCEGTVAIRTDGTLDATHGRGSWT